MQVIKDALKEAKIKKENPLVLYIQRQLANSNQATIKANRKLAVRIMLEMLIAGGIYSLYCYYFFHGIWYLDVLIVLATIVFMGCYLDRRLENIHAKTQSDIPKTTRKLRYYLIHTKNINKALEKTELKAPDTTRMYIRKMKDAVASKDIKGNIDKLKKEIKAEWLKMISNLVYYCKINGDSDNIVTSNLSRVTNVIEFINLQQGLDNASLKGAQNFVMFVPLIAIPGIQLFNTSLFNALDSPSLIDTLSSQTMAAGILLFSNIATIFISWIRKST